MAQAYRGIRNPDGTTRVLTPAGEDLPPRTDLREYADTFEWGYGGSGPSQLSLALLAHCLADDRQAMEHFHDFRRMAVANFEYDGWNLTVDDIRMTVDLIRSMRSQ